MALTGREREIRRVTDALGYRYAWDDRIGQYAHMAATAVLTPDGRLSSWLYGLNPTPAELDAAIDQAAAGRSGGVMQRLLVECYHYDPRTEHRVQKGLSWRFKIGLLTVLAIGLLILLLRRRGAA